MVMLEIAILDRLQSAHQQAGQLFKLDQSAFLLLQAVQGGNARRIQLCLVQGGAGLQINQAADASILQIHAQALRRIAPVETGKGASGNLEMIAVAGEAARHAPRAVVAVARGIELQQQGVGIHGPSRGKIEWPGEDPARDLPAQVVEALAQLVIETDRVGNEKSGKDTASQQDRRAQQAPAQREKGSETSEHVQTVVPGSEGASLAARCRPAGHRRDSVRRHRR